MKADLMMKDGNKDCSKNNVVLVVCKDGDIQLEYGNGVVETIKRERYDYIVIE